MREQSRGRLKSGGTPADMSEAGEEGDGSTDDPTRAQLASETSAPPAPPVPAPPVPNAPPKPGEGLSASSAAEALLAAARDASAPPGDLLPELEGIDGTSAAIDPAYFARLLYLAALTALLTPRTGPVSSGVRSSADRLSVRLTWQSGPQSRLGTPLPNPARAAALDELLALVQRLDGDMRFARRASGEHALDIRLDADGQVPRSMGRQAALRLLYAEDDVTSAQVMASLLQLQGITTEIALNGTDAVEMFRARRFDMLLVDPQMPVLDGLAAARQIREIEAAEARTRVPIAAISARDDFEARKACRAAGMDAYLAKPVRLDQLRALIARFAPRKAMQP